MDHNQTSGNLHPILVFSLLGLAGITLSEIAHRKVFPKFVPDSGLLTTNEFATAYKVNQEKAKAGDAKSLVFIQSANRRLREIHDRMILTQNDSDRRFLQELATRGITENDYMK